MEVAASLPHVLKVFPLRIIAREDFPPLQQVAFPSEAVKEAAEEMGEGEIGWKEACSHEEAHGICKEQQCNGGVSFLAGKSSNLSCHPSSLANHSSHLHCHSSSATSLLPRSSLPSILTNDLQLGSSVDALLSLPDKFYPQGQSKICIERVSLQSPLRNQRQPFKNAQGLSKQVEAPLSGQATAVLRSPSSVQQLSSPPTLSAVASPQKQPQAFLASSPLCSPSKLVEASLHPKKFKVLSPEAKHSQRSPTAERVSKASPFKAAIPQVNHSWASLPAVHDSCCYAPTHDLMPSSVKPICANSELQAWPVAAVIQRCEGSSLSFAEASPPQEHCHQVPSQPKHPLSPDAALEQKPQVYLESTSVQVCQQTSSPVMTQELGKRAFVTCAIGNKRSRSSAVRDYPEGCGKNLSLKLHGESNKPKMQTVKDNSQPDHGLTSLTKQVKNDEKLGTSQEVHLQHPACMMEDMAALCLDKSLETSVPSSKTQKVHISLKRKHDARSPADSLLQQVHRKPKVQHVFQISSPADETLSSSTLRERNLQIDWLPENCYDHEVPTERVVKLQGVKSQRGRPPRVVKFAKKSVIPSVEVDKLLPTEVTSGVSARFLVKKTLQEFDRVRRILAMSKDRHQRPDLAAANILKINGRWRNCGSEKIIGDVPGVEVGDQFSFRIEMLVIGLHRQVQGGIDYIAGSVRPEGPLATSIVASGGYEDDDDCGDTFVYTGQGGNNYKGDRRQACDQVLERGNLALSNSCKERTPVRVIRGCTDDKFYTYDGLYDVIDCWFQTGAAGFGVYQFKLSRRSGQPALGSSIVRFVGSVKKSLARPHLLMGDISHGKETLPICVVNEVDEEIAPMHFNYASKMRYPSWYHPEISKGCDCVGACVDASQCLCAAKNGGEFPYNEFGQIVTDNKVVFECGKSCACSSSCHNRVSQRGPKHMLEVFKTKKERLGREVPGTHQAWGFYM